MAVYERATRIDAPLSEVWAFHRHPDGLVELTPDWADLRIESIRGPDGESDPDELVVGTEVEVSVRPFGVGPRQRGTTRFVEVECGEETAHFRDVMVEGPFARWDHLHRFVADGDRTQLLDRVHWAMPGGLVGEGVAALGWPGLAVVFWYRHRRTRELLEG